MNSCLCIACSWRVRVAPARRRAYYHEAAPSAFIDIPRNRRDVIGGVTLHVLSSGALPCLACTAYDLLSDFWYVVHLTSSALHAHESAPVFFAHVTVTVFEIK
jgi:hypothetical protein